MTRRGIALLLISLPLLSWSGERPFSPADFDWTQRYFHSVLDELMPLKGNAGAYVVYRASSESELPEYWFVIGHDRNQDGHGPQTYLSAHVRVADTHSIFGQILRAHRSEPQEEIGSIQKRIKIRSFEVNEMSCPAFKDELEILKQLQTSVPKSDDNGVFIFGHPVKSEFHIESNVEEMSVVLLEHDKLPHENALLNWAYWTRRAFDSCSQGR